MFDLFVKGDKRSVLNKIKENKAFDPIDLQNHNY